MDKEIVLIIPEKTNVSPLIHANVIKLIEEHGIKACRYLDLGCGEGEFTDVVAKVVEAKCAYGVDLSENFLRALPEGIKGLMVNLNIQNIPLPNSYFGLVTAVEVIEHLQNPDNLMKESFRVLKPGGYLIISSPNLASWLNRALLFFGFQPARTEPSTGYWVGLPSGVRDKRKYSGHINLFTFKALEDLLWVYGFRTVSEIGYNFEYKSRVIRMLDRVLSKRAQLASGLVLLSQKGEFQDF